MILRLWFFGRVQILWRSGYSTRVVACCVGTKKAPQRRRGEKDRLEASHGCYLNQRMSRAIQVWSHHAKLNLK